MNPAEDTTSEPRWGLSNSAECLRSLSGKKVVGFLEGLLPLSRSDLARGNKTLVFDDGTGLTFNTTGAFWHESRADVMRALDRKAQQMSDAISTYQSVLEMAGQRRSEAHE